MLPGDYVRALELLMEAVDEPIVGTVTAQNGSSTTCNGWVASAVLGTLVIDAAGDGRAHPTGKMGSFGLAARRDYETVQAVAGGNRAQQRYLEVVTRGHGPPHRQRPAHSLERVGRLHRLRPQPAAGVVRRRARRGRGDQLRARPRRGAARRRAAAARRRVIDAAVAHLGGSILARGRGAREGAAHRERVRHRPVAVGELELGFVNEYLTAESDGERLATFPDVLATLSLASGRIISIADIAAATRSPCCTSPKAERPAR